METITRTELKEAIEFALSRSMITYDDQQAIRAIGENAVCVAVGTACAEGVGCPLNQANLWDGPRGLTPGPRYDFYANFDDEILGSLNDHNRRRSGVYKVVED